MASLDYEVAETFLELSFKKVDAFKKTKRAFPDRSALSTCINDVFKNIAPGNVATLPNDKCALFATAGVEMWHRAIHSFLWSVALTESSPIWSSVSGYYSSHFVMRALAHSMGIFKSFSQKKNYTDLL